jgi:hypothetical protein
MRRKLLLALFFLTGVSALMRSSGPSFCFPQPSSWAIGQWVPLHSMAVADYLSVLRTFQSVFPTATFWYTGGTHTLLLATPETVTDAQLAEALQAVYDRPAVLKDLGEPVEISRYWIMDKTNCASSGVRAILCGTTMLSFCLSTPK